MKLKYHVNVALVLLVIAVVVNATKKETQQQKHDLDKIHKKPFSGHWDGHKSKSEHHAVKEVLKHAPHSLSHHEVKTQLDLGHITNKKKLQPVASKSDFKLQDLGLEDAVHHKTQAHKVHGDKHTKLSSNGHEQHKSDKGVHKVAAVEAAHHSHNNVRANDKKEKKVLKKVILNKSKKYKRAKRLHKFAW